MDSTTIVLDSLLSNADMIVDTSFSVKALLTETISNSSNNQFLQGGLILGAIAWLAVQLKGIPTAIWNQIDRVIRYTVYFDENDDFYITFSEWYSENHPKNFRNVAVRLIGHKVILTQYIDFNTFRYKGKLLFVSKFRKDLPGAIDKDNIYLNYYIIYGFFARKALTELIDEIQLYKQIKDSNVK
jgi:hypothetical protein